MVALHKHFLLFDYHHVLFYAQKNEFLTFMQQTFKHYNFQMILMRAQGLLVWLYQEIALFKKLQTFNQQTCEHQEFSIFLYLTIFINASPKILLQVTKGYY